MFERIIIKNFQCYKYKEVVFDPNITVLVGPTDRGKSAIIRALRWVCLNKAPKNHIRIGAKFASVTLFVDGNKITRKQGKGYNYYSINGKKLKAFNRDVPEEVAEKINVDTTNFQRQRDSDFWLSLPAPQVTKELNKIVDLSVIDSSLANISTRIRKRKSAIEVHKKNLEIHRHTKKELTWVEDANTELMEIENESANCIQIESDVAQLESLVNDVSTIDQRLGELTSKRTELEEIVELAENIEEMKKESRSLETIILDLERFDKEICQLKKELESYERKIRLVKECPVCGNPIRQS